MILLFILLNLFTIFLECEEYYPAIQQPAVLIPLKPIPLPLPLPAVTEAPSEFSSEPPAPEVVGGIDAPPLTFTHMVCWYKINQ